MFTRDQLIEIFRYGMVSACAFAVDTGLLALLHFRFGMHYLVAATLSFIVGGVVAYLLSIRFVFVHRRIDSQAVEGPLFVALGLVGLGINALVMWLLVSKASAPVLLAKVGAACMTFGVNYLLRKLLLFSPAANASRSQTR